MLRKALKLSLAAAVSIGLMWSGAPDADNWAQWRGPNFNGSAPTARGLPVHWSPTENVRWRAELPSWSAATPIIWNDTVFVTSAEEGFNEAPRSERRGGAAGSQGARDKIFLLALNRADGKVRWRQTIGAGNRIYRKQNLSSPSPITDGKRVWAMTGGGDFSCWSFAGDKLWSRNLQEDYGEFGLNHGYASTPLLWRDRMYVQVLHGMKTDDPSYVFAVDPATGKTIWKVNRPTDAPRESPDDYSTPLVVKVQGREQLIVSGGDYVTGHDLATGKELWRKGGFNPDKQEFYRTIASSIAIGDVIYATSTRGKPFIAFRAGPAGKELWSNDLGSDVPTPTTDGKTIYVVNDRGIVVALDAKTGVTVWDRQRIEPGTYSASPLLADGKIYAVSEEGTTTVLETGPEFKILAVNKLNSHTLASPAAAGDQLFIRTAEHLYCLAKR